MELGKYLEESHEVIILLGVLVWSLDGFEWLTKLLHTHKVVG